MRALLIAAVLLGGCEWFEPETHVCTEGSFCPPSTACVVDENDPEGRGLCTRIDGPGHPDGDDDDSVPWDDDDTGPGDDDDTGPWDDDDAGPPAVGVDIEEPEEGETFWIANGEFAPIAANIRFPEGSPTPQRIRVTLSDQEIWAEGDDAWVLFNELTGYFFIGQATDTLGAPGPRTVRVEASDGDGWSAFDEVDVSLEPLPEGWLDRDGDGWCAGADEPFGLGGRDADGDGTCSGDERELATAFDCDDEDPARAPLLDEGCDGIDTDCDGSLGFDEVDGDGDGDLACIDCDDNDSSVNSGAVEVCDGADNNCDGHADEHEDPTELWESSLDDWQTVNSFIRRSEADVASCPGAGYGLPLCTPSSGPLCPAWSEVTGAISSPQDGYDVWRVSWTGATGLAAAGCGTTITITPPPGQPLSADLFVAPSPAALSSEWASPVPFALGDGGVLTATFDEADPSLTGYSFEDLAFYVRVQLDNSLPQCPTDGYTVTVEGY